jgi:hypothetical protein
VRACDDEAEPFTMYHGTPENVAFQWSPEVKIIMGSLADIQIGALLRLRGTLGDDQSIDARQIVVITHVARIAAD